MKIIYKNKKPFGKRPKGWKLTSSPYWSGLELFVGVKLWKNYETTYKLKELTSPPISAISPV
jgi:hypothetical protein